MAGSAVLRMVASSACMKNATATSQGSRRAVRVSRETGSTMVVLASITQRTVGFNRPCCQPCWAKAYWQAAATLASIRLALLFFRHRSALCGPSLSWP
ncbi:hypothetical protein D3C78_1797320 [compost metagenome]